jgi:hypothetical protein
MECPGGTYDYNGPNGIEYYVDGSGNEYLVVAAINLVRVSLSSNNSMQFITVSPSGALQGADGNYNERITK